MGLPVAATASASAICGAGMVISVRDCASPDMSCDSPIASRTMSAFCAAATAAAIPPGRGASISDPGAVVTVSPRARSPWAIVTLSFSSAMNAHVPTTFLRSSANGPISAMRPGSFFNGSSLLSFFSSTIERAPASRLSFSMEGVETLVRSAVWLTER